MFTAQPDRYSTFDFVNKFEQIDVSFPKFLQYQYHSMLSRFSQYCINHCQCRFLADMNIYIVYTAIQMDVTQKRINNVPETYQIYV